jgi:hypothetical protein
MPDAHDLRPELTALRRTTRGLGEIESELSRVGIAHFLEQSWKFDHTIERAR